MIAILMSLAVFIKPSPTRAAKPERIRIVFDMNGVTMDGWQATPNFGEILQILLFDPRVELFFFSSQSEEGITAQLHRVRLPDGRTADRVAKVLGRTSMTDLDALKKGAKVLSAPGGSARGSKSLVKSAMRSEAEFKDLRVISPNPVDLQNTILVDDDEIKSHKTQYANLLWVPRELGFVMPRKLVGLFDSARTSVPTIKPLDFKGAAMALPTKVARIKSENQRSDLILGTLRTAIGVADAIETTVTEALSQIIWLPPDTEGVSRLRLQNPSLERALMRYGRRIRKASKCELKMIERSAKLSRPT